MRAAVTVSVAVAVSVLFAVAVGAVEPSTRSSPKPEAVHLSIEKCVEIALENATDVVKARADEEVAGAQLLQAYAQFLPNLNTGLGYSYDWGKTLYTFNLVTLADSRSKNAQWTISSSLNLFNGLGDRAALRSALAQRDSARFSLQWARQQIALDVVTAYLQVVLDQQLLEISRRNLAASQARLKLLQGQARVGSATVADLYRQQAQTSSDLIALSAAESRVHDDEILLLRRIRLDPGAEYVFESVPLAVGPSELASRSLDSLVKEALESRLDLRSSSLRMEASRHEVDRANAAYWPRVDLVFNRTAAGHYLLQQDVNGRDALPDQQRDLLLQLGNQASYTLSLNLTWNIFNRLVDRLNVSRAERTRLYSETDYQDTRLQVEGDARIALNDYQVAQGQLKTAITGLEAAEKAFATVQGRYEVGASSFIDALSAQAALTQARSSEVQARINLLLRAKALEYSVGKLQLPK